MIEHVYQRVEEAQHIDEVIVLTDDQRIFDAVLAFGGRVEMTPADCASGTDRIAWAARNWQVDAVLNVQGDEPLIDSRDVARIAAHLCDYPDDEMVTLATEVDPEEQRDPNRVKVVFDRNKKALYFSRAPIPWPHSSKARKGGSTNKAPTGERVAKVYRHVGIYGYRLDTLLQLAALAPTPLEVSEALEQLRALENGIGIRVLEVEHAPISVDTEDDLAVVREIFSSSLERC